MSHYTTYSCVSLTFFRCVWVDGSDENPGEGGTCEQFAIFHGGFSIILNSTRVIDCIKIWRIYKLLESKLSIYLLNNERLLNLDQHPLHFYK